MAINSFKQAGLANLNPSTVNADFSNTATGSYTSGIINYKYISFVSGSNTLTVTKSGNASILACASGGSGGTPNPGNWAAGAGGGGGFLESEVWLKSGTYTAVIGAAATNGNGNTTYLSSTSLRLWLPGGGKGGQDNNIGSAGGSNGSGNTSTPFQNGVYGFASSGGNVAGGAGGTNGSGRTSTIRGTSEVFCAGGSLGLGVPANSGNGGAAASSLGSTQPGAAGIIIVRVRTN